MYEVPGFIPVPLCPVCKKPVPLDQAKTDEDGKAIHEECYINRLGITPPLRRDVSSVRLPELRRQK